MEELLKFIRDKAKSADRSEFCTVCGKKFDMWDEMADLHFETVAPYGSVYDMCRIKFDLCVECFDRILGDLLPKCRHDPIVREEM